MSGKYAVTHGVYEILAGALTPTSQRAFTLNVIKIKINLERRLLSKVYHNTFSK